MTPKYKRIVLKISGEALKGNGEDPHSPEILKDLARQLKEIHEIGVQICLVVGGGNIFRGLKGIDKALTEPRATTWECSQRSSTGLQS